MKITNPNYRQFLDKGIIHTLEENHIKKALKNIKGKYTREGRALLITLYYTGCRPNEALDIMSKNIKKQDSYITIELPGSKGGLPRTVYLQTNELTKELYQYASSMFPEMLIFNHYRSTYTRTTMTKNGPKTRTETTDKLRYYISKWFTGVIDNSITPYFLRHNRFSKLAIAGIEMQQIRQIKGSKGVESVSHYIHLSSKTAKDIAKKNK